MPKISNGNIMVDSRQKFPNRGGSKKIKNVPSSKISQVREGRGGSQNLGRVPKLYLEIKDFPKAFPRMSCFQTHISRIVCVYNDMFAVFPSVFRVKTPCVRNPHRGYPQVELSSKPYV